MTDRYVEPWVPEAGDLIWVHFGPVSGNEQDGRRPALVISPAQLNAINRRVVVLPVMTSVRGWATEVPLDKASGMEGVVLSDQIRSLSWETRAARPAGKASADVLAQVRDQLTFVLGMV